MCLVKNPKCHCDALIEWGYWRVWQKKFLLKAVLCKLIMAATVYHIWLQRNSRVYIRHAKSEDAIVTSIKWDVKTRIEFCKKVKLSLQNKVEVVTSIKWDVKTRIEFCKKVKLSLQKKVLWNWSISSKVFKNRRWFAVVDFF